MAQDVVDYAVAQFRKPYAERGWGPDKFDCVGLVCQSGIQAGVLVCDLSEETDDEIRFYSPRPKPLVLKRGLDKYMVRINKNDIKPGDILLFRDPREQHLGIVSNIMGPKRIYVVHASLRKKEVRHSSVPRPEYISAAWRFPGLANG